VMESQIAIPGMTADQFTAQVRNAEAGAASRIDSATATEPCGGDVRNDSSQACKFFGAINFLNQACN